MLLQSKNPQPRPNRIRNATATHSRPVCGALPTPNIAGTISAMPMRAREDSAARARPHPAIGQPAAGNRADDRRDLPVERRRHARQALADAELRLQDRRHPVAHDPAGQRRQREVEHEQDERAVAQQLAERADRETSRPRAAWPLGADRGSAGTEQRHARRAMPTTPHASNAHRQPSVGMIGHVAAEAADDHAARRSPSGAGRRRASASGRGGSRRSAPAPPGCRTPR